jgi:Fe-S cluster biogenesis protein NfuA
MNSNEFQEKTGEIDRLVQRVSAFADENARTTSLELLQSMMDLHGAAMSRIVELLSESGEAGRSALTKLGSDPLICGLLVLYGIHPVSLQQRVSRAVEGIRPKLQKHGGSVELIEVTEDAVRLNIQSSGHGCGSSPDGLKSIVEQAILEAAPDVISIHISGAEPETPGFVPLNMIQPVTKEEMKYEKSTA